MRNLYKLGKNTLKNIATGIAFLGAGIAAEGASQPTADALGLDDLVNNANAEAHVMRADLDLAVAELGDLSQVRWERYDIGSGVKMWRFYQDSNPNDLLADSDFSEVRFIYDMASASDDTAKVNGLALVPKGDLYIPQDASTWWNEPGSMNEVDNQGEYLARGESLEFGYGPNQKPYVDVENSGTKTFWVNTDSTTQEERDIAEQKVLAFNDSQKYSTPTSIFQPYNNASGSGHSPGSASSWKIAFEDNVPGEGIVYPNKSTIVIDRNGGNIPDTVLKEVAQAITGSQFDTLTHLSGQVEAQDILTNRLRYHTAVSGGPSEGIFLGTLYAPNSDSNVGSGPDNIPEGNLEARGWLNADGTMVDDISIIGTAAPDLERRLAELYQNTPNPFNAKTVIGYQLESESRVDIDIYDVKGRLVRELVDQVMPAGGYVTQWDGKDDSGNTAASGTYFARMKTDFGEETKKMTLVK